MSRKICPVLVLAALLILPGAALGYRAPTASERTAIAAALGAAGPAKCLFIRVSTANTSYAFAENVLQVPNASKSLVRACTPTAANGIALLRRVDGRWKRVFEGSTYRCSRSQSGSFPVIPLPAAVVRDFRKLLHC
jgi:hypothetical protein